MRKLVGVAAFAAALSMAGGISLVPASAAQPAANVVAPKDARQANATTTDISARRRHYRRYGYYHGPRFYRRGYYRPYYRPYYGYGYGYRPYYRPYYYRPAYYRPYYRPYPYYGYGFGGPRFYGPGFSIGFGW